MKVLNYFILTHLGRIVSGSFLMVVFLPLAEITNKYFAIPGYIGLMILLAEFFILTYWAFRNFFNS